MQKRSVFVVMGNDYPDCVFTTEKSAEAYCEGRRKEFQKGQARIYWRIYEFRLRGK